MVRLIVGKKGKGKTRHLLDQANTAVKEANGSIVYLDKNSKHMYELNNRIRLIDLSSFKLSASEEMMGFLFGVISQDHDLQSVYMDGFLKCAKLEGQSITDTLLRLDSISSMFNITLYISVSVDKEELPEELREKVLVSL